MMSDAIMQGMTYGLGAYTAVSFIYGASGAGRPKPHAPPAAAAASHSTAAAAAAPGHAEHHHHAADAHAAAPAAAAGAAPRVGGATDCTSPRSLVSKQVNKQLTRGNLNAATIFGQLNAISDRLTKIEKALGI